MEWGTQLFNSNTPFEVTANGKSKRKRFLTINRKKEKGKEKKERQRPFWLIQTEMLRACLILVFKN